MKSEVNALYGSLAAPVPSVKVSLFHLYGLRGLYLLVVVGLGMQVWPGVFQNSGNWELMEGAVQCMLAAFWACCLLGVRYPLRMLPILFWELGWKSMWLLAVAVPQWLSGQMDESTWATAWACLMVLIFPLFMPWRYIFATYVRKGGDRWR